MRKMGLKTTAAAVAASAAALALAAPLSATIVWGSINGPELTQGIMDECYGGQDPGPVEVDECGCNALGYPYSWDGGGCIDDLNPGG